MSSSVKPKVSFIKILFIKTNFDLCTGCSICQLACSMTDNQGFNPRRARLLVHHKKENLYHTPVVCNHCQNPYCMNVCPAKAYSRTESGAVIIDTDKCVGCGICVSYCPEGLVHLSPEKKGKAVKCDMCQGAPRCVDACPTGALELAFRAHAINVSYDSDDNGRPVNEPDRTEE